MVYGEKERNQGFGLVGREEFRGISRVKGGSTVLASGDPRPTGELALEAYCFGEPESAFGGWRFGS